MSADEVSVEQLKARIEELERKNTNLALRVIEIEAVDNAAADFGKASYAYVNAWDKWAAFSAKGEQFTDEGRAAWTEVNRLADEVDRQRARLTTNINAQQFRQEEQG